MSTILDAIYVTDTHVTQITLKNSLAHRFILQQKNREVLPFPVTLWYQIGYAYSRSVNLSHDRVFLQVFKRRKLSVHFLRVPPITSIASPKLKNL